MKTNKNAIVAAIILTMVTLIAIMRNLTSEQYLQVQPVDDVNTSQSVTPETENSKTKGHSSTFSFFKSADSISSESSSESARPTSYLESRVEESKTSFATFQEKSHLGINLGEEMLFSAGESEIDNSIAVNGVSPDGKMYLTMVASTFNPAKEDAIKYVKESPMEFAAIGKSQVKWSETSEPVELKAESGIKDAVMWNGEDENGDQFYTILMKRQDEKGSYLFIQKGPKERLEENEGYWEMVRDSVKAEPIK